MALLGILVSLGKWVFEAAVQYNATPEGEAGLTDILDNLEAMGIDIPFYTPTTQDGSLNMSSVPQTATQSDVEFANAFRAKHPELFKQEGGQS
jgi:hypothetical protein